MNNTTTVINSVAKTSSVIKRLTYNNVRQDLKINFKTGKEYLYTPVSEEFFKKFKNSNSKGSFFNNHIKKNQALTCFKLID